MYLLKLLTPNTRHHDRARNIRYFYRENPEVPVMAMQQVRRLLESGPIIPRAIQMDMVTVQVFFPEYAPYFSFYQLL